MAVGRALCGWPSEEAHRWSAGAGSARAASIGCPNRMSFTQEGGHIPPEYLDQTIAGWHSFFDRMGELVG